MNEQTTNVLADAVNPAGARAYTTPDREFVARLALESRTAPTDGTVVTKLHRAVMAESNPTFVKNAALYASLEAGNRDISMALCAFIYARARSMRGEARVEWFDAGREVIQHAMTNLSCLRSFMNYYRGPAQNRHATWGYSASIGGRLQKDLKRWINAQPTDQLVKGRAGTPSMKDIFRMIHPGTNDEMRNNTYKWLIGGGMVLPIEPLVVDQHLLETGELPSEDSEVWKQPLDVLGPLIGSNEEGWKRIARQSHGRGILKNLSTFARRLVYTDADLLSLHVDRLRNLRNVSPYEVFRTIQNTDEQVPVELVGELNIVLENSLSNVERHTQPCIVLVDVSASMQSPLGHHRRRQSALRCCDAAGLLVAAITQSGDNVAVVPFDTRIRDVSQLNEAPGVRGIADAVANYKGGGTNVGLAFDRLAAGDFGFVPNVVLISDNQSLPGFDQARAQNYWMRGGAGGGTNAQEAWHAYGSQVENARLLLMDVAVDGTQQVIGNNVTGMAGWNPKSLEMVGDWLRGDEAAVVEEIAEHVNRHDLVEEILNYSVDEAH